MDEIIIIDDDDILFEDDYRNAGNRRSRGGISSSSGRGRTRRGRGRRIITTGNTRGPRRPTRTAEPVSSSPFGNFGGGNLGMIVDAAAQVLAALQPLPGSPPATGDTKDDLANLITYQKALAEHAKRDEQLRTVGSLATKLF